MAFPIGVSDAIIGAQRAQEAQAIKEQQAARAAREGLLQDKQIEAIDYNSAKQKKADELAEEARLRAQRANVAANKMRFGDYSGVKQFYNTDFNDGKTATSVQEKDPETISLLYPDGTAKDIPKIVVHEFLMEAQKPGSQADITINALKKQREGEATGEIEARKTAAEVARGGLEETIRNNKANNKINASKPTGDTTAEQKNMNMLLQFKIAKDEKEAWEMVRTGKTPGGDKVISDGLGGVIVQDPDGNIVKYDSRGKSKVIKGAAPAASSGIDLNQFAQK